ncbi:MAG: DNA replication/repair protein RecF [Longimicrobiales bacterium]
MTNAATALVCRELRLRQFRNFASLDVVFPAPGVAVVGDNGAGKTNLLEALYYLEIFRSFRGAPDEQLVRFGGEAFHVRGLFVDTATGTEREVTAAYEPRTRRKRVTVDGLEQERLGDAIGVVGTVVFSPGDMAIVAGPPAERRRFLDIVLSLNAPGYLAALQRYRQVLRQRNALLRDGAAAPSLVPWDDALAEWGGRIVAARATWVEGSREAFATTCEAISGGTPASLRYRARLPGNAPLEDAATAAAALGTELERLAPRERERGVTLVGPHRDDLAMLACGPDGEVDLRDFGSGGQLRTAAVALRMVEAETVRRVRGRTPLVLLDDVFAELDPGRSRRILELLDREERGQVILTAPRESDVELRRTDVAGSFASSLATWRIAGGVVSA